jgi:hypothetical protein
MICSLCGQEYEHLGLHTRATCAAVTRRHPLSVICPCGSPIARLLRFSPPGEDPHFRADKTVEEHLLRMLVEKP